jgi:hypothetical protein
MFIIVHTEACAQQACRIAEKLGECSAIPMERALSDPACLGDFDSLGLVFEKEGKGTPQQVMDFIRNVLSEYDLTGMQYMFSACVCDGNPAHALKIVEKFCAKVGCAPSLSTTVSPTAGEQEMNDLVSRIEAGDIQLAKGSPGTMWFMKAHGIRLK